MWIDSNGTDLSNLSGETIDANVWTEFMMYDEVGPEIIVNFDVNGGSAIDNINNMVFTKTEEYTEPGEYIFAAPVSGIYQLEVWGAQGGCAYACSSGLGGYGGYSVGTVHLDENEEIFVNVGGRGQNAEKIGTGYNGGYNGGGNSYAWPSTYNGSGGGATHISTISGELKTLSPNDDLDKILIIAGGGGGGASDGTSKADGGAGGGYQGYNGNEPPNLDGGYGHGGTQVLGGSYTVNNNRGVPSSGSFGMGGNSATTGGAGGGGGYYGGGGASVRRVCGGDGAARITYLGYIKEITSGDVYGDLPTPTREGYTFLGWFTEIEGGTKITSDTVFNDNSDQTLYAHWSVN